MPAPIEPAAGGAIEAKRAKAYNGSPKLFAILLA